MAGQCWWTGPRQWSRRGLAGDSNDSLGANVDDLEKLVPESIVVKQV